MEFTCKNCGNVFGDYLTVCPSCGTPVDSAAEETKAVDQEPEMQAGAEAAQQPFQQETQQQPFQQQPFQQQPYQQQPYQQQPYQQQPYQQQGYQQQGYQQQPYQQQGYQQPYQNANGYNYNPNAAYQAGAPVYNPPKSRMVAGLLGIFLGGIGVHNFYLGFTSKAVIQILVTFISCGLGGIWGFIEGIMIIAGSINTDAQGRPLTE